MLWKHFNYKIAFIFTILVWLLCTLPSTQAINNPNSGPGGTPLSPNQIPTVSAGPDQTVTPDSLPTTVQLNGIATDDNLPIGSTLTTSWSNVTDLQNTSPNTTVSKINGSLNFSAASILAYVAQYLLTPNHLSVVTPTSGTVLFSCATCLSTSATFSQAGTYILRLTASDGALSNSNDVNITINPPPIIPPPPQTATTTPPIATTTPPVNPPPPPPPSDNQNNLDNQDNYDSQWSYEDNSWWQNQNDWSQYENYENSDQLWSYIDGNWVYNGEQSPSYDANGLPLINTQPINNSGLPNIQLPSNTLYVSPHSRTLTPYHSSNTTIKAPVPLPVRLTHNLKLNDKSEEVRLFKQTLNILGYAIATSGPDSLGKETTTFDPQTKEALIRFQTKYVGSGLMPNGVVDNITMILLNKNIEKLSSKIIPNINPPNVATTTSQPSGLKPVESTINTISSSETSEPLPEPAQENTSNTGLVPRITTFFTGIFRSIIGTH